MKVLGTSTRNIVSSLWRSTNTPITQRHTECKFLPGIHPHHLWQVIRDVDAYSEFLPLCHHSKVLRRQGCEWMDATLTVGVPPLLMETFISRVHVTTIPAPNNNQKEKEEIIKSNPSNPLSETLVVEASSIQSKMLDSLSSRWELQAKVNSDENPSCMRRDFFHNSMGGDDQPQIGTLVNFWMEMTVSDPLIVTGLNHMLKEVAGRQVTAFEQRCRSISFHDKENVND
jgi:ribosome-associated toxin RatA of RatAB toxin-antitoxin module